MTIHDAQYRYRVSRCSPLVGATPVGSLGLLGAGGGPVAGLGGGAPVLGHVVTGGGGGNSGHRGGGGSGGGSVSGPVLKVLNDLLFLVHKISSSSCACVSFKSKYFKA